LLIVDYLSLLPQLFALDAAAAATAAAMFVGPLTHLQRQESATSAITINAATATAATTAAIVVNAVALTTAIFAAITLASAVATAIALIAAVAYATAPTAAIAAAIALASTFAAIINNAINLISAIALYHCRGCHRSHCSNSHGLCHCFCRVSVTIAALPLYSNSNQHICAVLFAANFLLFYC
jgi:hypothetical protein